MKLEEKQLITVQVYPGRKFGTMIGSNDGLIGILLNSGEYIDVPQERENCIGGGGRWKRRGLVLSVKGV